MDAALVAVIGEGDSLLGSGFTVLPGTALTCHHVVDGMERVLVRRNGHADIYARVTPYSDHDLAVLAWTDEDGDSLPVAQDNGTIRQWWSKGYLPVSGVISAFPLSGYVPGHADVRYLDYTIRQALVLRDDNFDEGLSGSPVVDPDSGAVVGIISSRLSQAGRSGGFAIPFGGSRTPQGVETLLRRNRDEVPAWGRHLNQRGAALLCRRQTEGAIADLEAAGRIDLQRTVVRSSVDEAIVAYLASGDHLLAIVGPSGSGKSSCLARWASRSTLPTLFLRGSDLYIEDTGGAAAIDRSVRAMTAPPPLPEKLADSLARNLTDWAVLIDAINESPLRGAAGEWLTRTETWARAVGAHVIITSRPEFWRLVGPPDSSSARPPGAPQVLYLGDFTKEEASAARNAYGLKVSSDETLLRNPLMLRLASLQPGTNAGSEQALIKRFVDEKCRAIALTVRGEYSLDRVASGLQRLVGALEPLIGYDFPRDVAHRAVDPDRRIVDLLVEEHVLAQTDGSYRFTYDKVAEHLLGWALDPDIELDHARLDTLDDDQVGRRTGALAAMLLLHEDASDHFELRDLLSRIVADFTDRWRPAVVRLLADVLARVRNATDYRPILRTVATLEAAALRSALDRHPRVVIAVLSECLQEDFGGWLGFNIQLLLSDADEAEMPQLVPLLRLMRARPNGAYDCGRLLEDWSGRLDHPPHGAVAEVFEEVMVEGPSSARTPLIYYLAWPSPNGEVAAFKQGSFARLIEHTTDVATLHLAAEQCLRSTTYDNGVLLADPLGLLNLVANRLDPQSFGEAILSAAYTASLGATLAAWLDQAPELSTGDALLRFRVLAVTHTPDEAIRLALGI